MASPARAPPARNVPRLAPVTSPRPRAKPSRAARRPGTVPARQLCLAASKQERAGGSDDKWGVENTGELDFLSVVGALGVWLLYGGSIYWTLFRPDAPGNPLWATSAREFEAFIHQTISVFYMNPILSHFGWSLLPDTPEHPVSEALYNVTMSFDVMLLPLIAADPRGRNVEKRNFLMWGSLLFLNLFIMPYMALRLQQPSTGTQKPRLPGWAPAIGWFGLLMAGMTVYWLLFARPEYGGLMDRLSFTGEQFTTNRVFYSLTTDCIFFSIFQAILMKSAPWRLRLVPFVGAALWLALPDAWEQSDE